MKNDSINENEAIQEGLEKFLQEELAGMAGSRTTKQPMHQEMRQPVQQPRKEIEPDLIYGGEVRHDAYEDRMSYVPYDEDDGGDYFEETEKDGLKGRVQTLQERRDQNVAHKGITLKETEIIR